MGLNSLRNLVTIVVASFIIVALSFQSSSAQNWNEIFRQKKTQQKYLLQQIAALQVYTGYLKKGYEIASSGLNTIKDLSNGEFSLHNAFISGLKKVSPEIRNSVKVTEIIEMQLAIGKSFGGLKSSPNLTLANQLYVQEVRENVWEECLKDLEQLLLVITSGRVEMTADERLELLNTIYDSMRDKSAFVQHFTSEVAVLIRQKENEQRLIDQTRKSYGIKD